MTIIENLSELSLQYFALLRQISSKYELTLSQSLILLSTPLFPAPVAAATRSRPASSFEASG